MDEGYINEAIRQSTLGFPQDLPPVGGLSSDRIRRLLNWLCQPEGTNYLEIGVYAGSTFVSALYNNRAIASCVDNWSLYGIEREAFEENVALHFPGREINIIDGDMQTVDIGLLVPGVTVYFYDGEHTEEAHYQAFAHYNSVFANCFVAVIDDWAWDFVRDGTLRAFSELNYDIEAQWELQARFVGDADTWWNGLFVAIIDKE